MNGLFPVMVGGAIGAGARHLIGQIMLARLGPGFPWWTLVINILGSLLMGLLIGWLARSGGSDTARLFFGVGILGGFTTFSSFSLQTLDLLQAGEPGRAALNVGLSVALGLTAAALGFMLPGAVATVSRTVGA